MKPIQNRQLGAEQRSAAGRDAARAGVTLSEVLISMLIMSIGVVSLATLFPISVLRSAQATQLTQSVFLRNNAEAAVESNLGLLSNFYMSNTLPGTYAIPLVQNIPLGTDAVVDPLGLQYVGGKLGGTITRTHGGATGIPQAEQLAGLPDSWTLVFEDVVTAVTATQITTNTSTTGMNPRNGQNPGYARYRMVMYDITGKLAVLKDLYQVSGNNLVWQNINSMGTPLPAAGLPTGFTPRRVRVEVQQVRYSYLLAVRKRAVLTVAGDSSWVADVDVAVFFNRSFKPADEAAFTISFPSGVNSGMGYDNANGVKGVDDDGNGTVDDATEKGWPGSDDNRTVLLSGIALPITSTPYLKKGSYMLETRMLKWYRIVDFNKTTGVVLFDQDVRFSPATVALNGIFLKGLVDVFPLGSRTGQQ